MNTTAFSAEELVEWATAMAKVDRNLELMDRATILHGYLELTRLDPNNGTYLKNVQDAVASLLEAAHQTRKCAVVIQLEEFKSAAA